MYIYDVKKGRYEDRSSFIHSLDPRVKLYSLIADILMCIFAKNFLLLIIPFVILCLNIYLSQVNVTSYLRSLRGITIILVIGFLFNLLIVPFKSALLLLLKLYIMAFLCVILVKTTTTRDLLRGMKKGFGMKEEMAMSMTVALIFLPVLGNEMNMIRVAQAARGADITEGSLAARLKNSISIIIPLFRKTINKAEKMADAMDIRCYDSAEAHTEIDKLQMDSADRIYLIIMIAFLILMTAMFILL